MMVHMDVQLHRVIFNINFHLLEKPLKKIKSLSKLCLNHDVKRYASKNTQANLDKSQVLESFLIFRFKTARYLGEKGGVFVGLIFDTVAVRVQKLNEIRHHKLFFVFESLDEVLWNFDAFVTIEFARAIRDSFLVPLCGIVDAA